MRKAPFYLLLIICLACGNDQIVVDGLEREYLVYSPKSDAPLPVLLVLHGNPSTGWQMKTWTGMNDVAKQENFIVVYPYAADKRWPIMPEENGGEIKYIAGLLSDLGKKYNIDERRIYVCGMSGGGIFSFQLIKELPNTFAAFAVVAGNMPISYNSTDFQQTPFMYVHGTEDFLYPGREELYSAEQTLNLWEKINDTEGKEENAIPDLTEKDDSKVHRIEYRGESPIVFYKVEGGGHHWPQAQFDANLFYSEPLGNFNKDLNTNRAIWEFVSQYSKSK